MISEQMKNMIKVCLCLALMWMLFLSIAPRTNASTPLLENGGFESPILADGVIPGWKKGNAAQPTNQHVVTRENSADGEHSFKLVDDSDAVCDKAFFVFECIKK
ncbi:hypothetical protein [Paenibacillus sp. IITD108]|uniref:hypothetical protein n=1 Tax=Paenibacillus sp. IITD108 TaxID=3116649 RepID=UPI002F402880